MYLITVVRRTNDIGVMSYTVHGLRLGSGDVQFSEPVSSLSQPEKCCKWRQNQGIASAFAKFNEMRKLRILHTLIV